MSILIPRTWYSNLVCKYFSCYW